jgi:hypothetical protein
MAYHFAAKPLLLLDISTSHLQHLQLTGAALAVQKFDNQTCWNGVTLKVTELFSKAILLTMFVYGCVLDFIHLSATGVAEIAESTHLKVSTYFCVYSV